VSTTSIPSPPKEELEFFPRDIHQTKGRQDASSNRQNDLLGADSTLRKQIRVAAIKLAELRRLNGKPVLNSWFARFESNASYLERAIQASRESAAKEEFVSSADQWLVDNHHSIQEQIESARSDLPRNNNHAFKKYRGGSQINYEHIYALTRELVDRLEGRLDLDVVRECVAAYQSVVILTQVELWAIPNMMRLALLDFLCRAVGDDCTSGVEIKLRSNGDVPDVSRASNQDFRLVAIHESILSLRALNTLDWKEFVENASIVESILRQDPAGIYEKMDFASRGHYLSIIEKLAIRSKKSEEVIARTALKCARQTGKTHPFLPPSSNILQKDIHEPVQSHVGYYFLVQGRKSFEKLIGYRPAWKERLAPADSGIAFRYYFGAIVLVWLLAIAGASTLGSLLGISNHVAPLAYYSLLAFTAFVTVQFAINLVNWLSTLTVPPRPMMRLDFSKGIPNEYRTLVAVPAMLTGEYALRKLARQLEVRYAANRDHNMLFALVTDFPDAAKETMPDDEKLLASAKAEIQRLNQTYCPNGPSRFYLLHRSRKWNPWECVWMGEERKRGKLADLNHILRSGARDRFSTTAGDLSRLASVRYVITLDTDTLLPRDAGRKLAACLAHPLNRLRIDPQTGSVAEGYAILQPRVGVPISDANRSLYSRMLAGDAGTDPYTRQSSNLYGDLFDRCSFIGKGIYDVEAFDAALAGRFPRNRILSHDLIESCFAPCGFVSDVDLFEGVPFRYLADMKRRHRWIRGDWQIASWLMPSVPTARGKSPNPLTWLSRWKIFDNLRRSLEPLFQLTLLLLGWFLTPHHALFWTVLVLFTISGHSLLAAGLGFLRKPAGKPLWLHLKNQSSRAIRGLSAEALALCMMPYAAYCHLDAIARALYRTHVSRKKMLEWATSGEVEARCNHGLVKHYQVMWPCAFVALTVGGFLAAMQPAALWFAAPILMAWLAAPWIAWRISQPLMVDALRLSGRQQRQFRRFARQTWHYFETYANEKTHGLPPDNVQDHSGRSVVSNTSPTNIGLGLTAGLAACDLGYLSASSFLERTSRALKAMRRLKRFRGHFFNWYDSLTLEPAEPRYVSSVDSGNLWGSLIVLRSGLEELRDRPLLPPRLFEGLQDTLEAIATLRSPVQDAAAIDRFEFVLDQLRKICGNSRCDGTRNAYRRLRNIHALAVELDAGVPAQEHDLKRWTKSFVRQCAEAKRELSLLAFWSRFPASSRASDKWLPELKELHSQLRDFDAHCTLKLLPEAADRVIARIDPLFETLTNDPPVNAEVPQKLITHLEAMRRAATKAAAAARYQLDQISSLADYCRQFCAMDFEFLFHPQRRLLSVGFDATTRRLDESYYDLLASESRLTSFLAISHGQLPAEHWHNLGRPVRLPDGKPMLLSWSGSMFEYLMPLLFMPSYRGSFLDASCRAALERQIRFAREKDVPWGISESCFNRRYPNRAYQYRAFGVPELSVQREFHEHLAVAPYASALAAGIAPNDAYANLERLQRLGCLGPHGFYDAIDFTLRDHALNERPTPCRIVMAHHSGMTLLALANALLDNPMVRRFLENPFCESHVMLLQERIPQPIKPHR
jgi:cyclic beta-1,2-glucan synthetase